VGPFLVNSQTSLYVRESDVTPGGSSGKYMVWDTATGEARAHDAPGILPALTGVYRVVKSIANWIEGRELPNTISQNV
jgi:hypothetical protein